MESLHTSRFHHVGIVVKAIEPFIDAGGYELASDVVSDAIQGARLCLVRQFGERSVHVELVEPVGPASPLRGALERGGGFHHICYQVATCEAADRLVESHGCLSVTPWQPAVLFDGRLVRFVYTRNRQLIEFLADDRDF